MFLIQSEQTTYKSKLQQSIYIKLHLSPPQISILVWLVLLAVLSLLDNLDLLLVIIVQKSKLSVQSD